MVAYLHRNNLVVDAPDKCDPRTIVEYPLQRILEALRVGALGIAKVPQLSGRSHQETRFVVGKRSQRDARHRTHANLGIGNDAQVNELVEQD